MVMKILWVYGIQILHTHNEIYIFSILHCLTEGNIYLINFVYVTINLNHYM